jgi:membrane protein YqaA with SNARE-associated domain
MNEISNLALSLGYPGVFLVSFIASTLIPFSNEIVVAAMPALGFDIWLTAIWATAGGYLGSLLNYLVGKKGADFLFSRWIKIKPARWQQAEEIFQRWGNWALFFVWLPIIGDPLAVVAGAFNIDWRLFTFWVVTGKFLRFVVLLGVLYWFV